MKKHLESLAGLAIVVTAVIGFYLLILVIGGDCPSGSTEFMCGQRW